VSTFLDITTREKHSVNTDDEHFPGVNNTLNQVNNENTTNILDNLRKSFLNTQEKENIFTQNSGLNIFVSNIIDDKQDIIDNLSKVIDEKLENIDGKLYKIDEIIEKFAKCKTENERLKSKISNLRDENYVLKNEIGKFSKLAFSIFFKKSKH